MEATQFWQLYAALIHAFPTEADLVEMVRVRLNENLASITAATNLQEKVFDLIHWAEAQGKLADLLMVAQKANPTDVRLQALTVPPELAPAARQRSRAIGTVKYVGQWVLAIVLVLGCELTVVASLVANALDRFSAGDNLLAWIYLLVGLGILLTVSIGILSTIRSEVRKRSQRR